MEPIDISVSLSDSAGLEGAEADFVRGRDLHKAGRLAEAETAYGEALKVLESVFERPGEPANSNPSSPVPAWSADLLHLLGALRIQQLLGAVGLGENDEDDESDAQARSRQKPEASLVRDVVVLPPGTEEALVLLQRASNLRAGDWRIWNSLGLARLQASSWGRPKGTCNEALARAAAEAWDRAASLQSGAGKWAPLNGAQQAFRRLEKIDGRRSLEKRVGYLREMSEIRPTDQGIHYRLGCCLRELGGHHNSDAILAFERHLSVVGEGGRKAAHSQYWLALLRGETPLTAPAEYVASLFDFYADNFEEHLVNKLQYKTPSALLEELRAGKELGPIHRAADLGCGTGLMGPLLRRDLGVPVQRLEGVDLSPEMLRKAAEKQCYDFLLAADLLRIYTSLAESKLMAARAEGGVCVLSTEQDHEHESDVNARCCESENPSDRCDGCRRETTLEDEDLFDLVAAADVFVYIGDLDEVFVQTRRWIRVGGIFGFSVETGFDPCESAPPAPPAGYQLCDTGRFTHRPEYIAGLANKHGFSMDRTRDLVLRYNGGKPVHGRVFVLRAV
eukprot:TRINITY_DN39960_c0_g1_i1.p1 TRINITY_DN39960_c0_g1~~TRINITY_DN39960_c0_g1_i1.p1  ORF type:complete len:562 (+),score=87.84 TRINITY_DN39960_c0_g1_i1:107-1792(+)